MELDPRSSADAKLYGNYRAKVVDNKDPLKCGRVMVWIPDIMITVSETFGLWARPANNPVGGRNLEGDPEHHYMGTCYIPKKGAWVWIFFEAGNINRPYYFGALDLENTTVLPENQLGTNYEDKWTIFKSHEGRAIVISDDPYDARVEITGTKRMLDTDENGKKINPPCGDGGTVYQIDGNQSTILIDERQGKQKILIRTVKGDFLNLNIEKQTLEAFFKSDIIIRTDGNILMTAQGNIELKSSAGDVKVAAEAGYLDTYAAADYKEYAGGAKNSKAMGNQNIESQAEIHEFAGGNINTDAGGTRNDQCGMAQTAEKAIIPASAIPAGKRNS